LIKNKTRTQETTKMSLTEIKVDLSTVG